MARRPLTSPWTPELEEKLKLLAAQGATETRAAAALKRPLSTVRLKARKLGLSILGARALKAKYRKLDAERVADDRLAR
jgi:hypothetical protein